MHPLMDLDFDKHTLGHQLYVVVFLVLFESKISMFMELQNKSLFCSSMFFDWLKNWKCSSF